MLESGKMQMEAGSAKSKVCKGSGNKSRILTHALRPGKGIEIENRKENECKRYQIQRGITSKVEKEEVYQLTNMVFIVLFTAFSCCFYSRIWGVWISEICQTHVCLDDRNIEHLLDVFTAFVCFFYTFCTT